MKNWNSGNAERMGESLVSIIEEKITRYSRVSHYSFDYGRARHGQNDDCQEASRAEQSPRKGFINLNCSSLSQKLLESELFGYEKGAFTGATAPKIGLFEIASAERSS